MIASVSGTNGAIHCSANMVPGIQPRERINDHVKGVLSLTKGTAEGAKQYRVRF